MLWHSSTVRYTSFVNRSISLHCTCSFLILLSTQINFVQFRYLRRIKIFFKTYCTVHTTPTVSFYFKVSVVCAGYSICQLPYLLFIQTSLTVNVRFICLLLHYIYVCICVSLYSTSVSFPFSAYLSACKYYVLTPSVVPPPPYLSTSNVSFCTIHTCILYICKYKLLRALSITYTFISV